MRFIFFLCAHSFSGDDEISWPNHYLEKVELVPYYLKTRSTDYENRKIKCKKVVCFCVNVKKENSSFAFNKCILHLVDQIYNMYRIFL